MYIGYVLIQSNLVEIQVPIKITAKQGVEVYPSKVNFGTLTTISQNRTRVIELENFHSEPVSILDIRLSEPDDRMSLFFDPDLVALPSSRHEACRMSFVATEEQVKFEGELLIYTSLTHTWVSAPGPTFNRNLRPIKSNNSNSPQKPLVIPYKGRVLSGSLVYIKNTVLFDVEADEITLQPKNVTREVKLRNTFKVPLHVTSVQIADELFEVTQFEPKVAQPDELFTLCVIEFYPTCMNLRYTADLRLATNVSVLHIPLSVHNGGLHVTSPDSIENAAQFYLTHRSDGSGYVPRLGRGGIIIADRVFDELVLQLDDLFDGQLMFGDVVLEEEYRHSLEFVNDNPYNIVIQEVSTSSDMVTAYFPMSDGPSHPIELASKQWETLVVKIIVPLGKESKQHSHIVTIETSAQTFRIEVSFTPITGLVKFDSIVFSPIFPGIVSNQSLFATSSYRHAVAFNPDVQSSDPRFTVKIRRTDLPPKDTVEVGYVIFDPSKCDSSENYMSLSLPNVVAWDDFASTDAYPTREEYALMKHSKDIWDQLEADGKTKLYEHLTVHIEDNNEVSEVSVDISASLEFPTVLSQTQLLFPTIRVNSVHISVVNFVNPTNSPVFIQTLPLVDEHYMEAIAAGKDSKELPDPEASASPFRVENQVESASRILGPHEHASIGTVYFQPMSSGKFSTDLYIRNNLTHLTTVRLIGEGGRGGLEIVSNDPSVRVDSRNDTHNLFGYTPSGYSFNLDLDYDALGIEYRENGTFMFSSPTSYVYNKTSATMTISFSIRNSGNMPLTISNFYLGNVEDVPLGSLAYTTQKQEAGCFKYHERDSAMRPSSSRSRPRAARSVSSPSSTSPSSSGAIITSPEEPPPSSFFSFISTIFWAPPPKRDGRNLGYGFHVHGCSCLPTILNPQESREFSLEYQPDFHTHRIDTQLLVKTDFGDYNAPVTVSIPDGLVPMLLALQPLSEREIFFRRMLVCVVAMVLSVTWWNVVWECRLYTVRPLTTGSNSNSVEQDSCNDSTKKLVSPDSPPTSPALSPSSDAQGEVVKQSDMSESFDNDINDGIYDDDDELSLILSSSDSSSSSSSPSASSSSSVSSNEEPIDEPLNTPSSVTAKPSGKRGDKRPSRGRSPAAGSAAPHVPAVVSPSLPAVTVPVVTKRKSPSSTDSTSSSSSSSSSQSQRFTTPRKKGNRDRHKHHHQQQQRDAKSKRDASSNRNSNNNNGGGGGAKSKVVGGGTPQSAASAPPTTTASASAAHAANGADKLRRKRKKDQQKSGPRKSTDHQKKPESRRPSPPVGPAPTSGTTTTPSRRQYSSTSLSHIRKSPPVTTSTVPTHSHMKSSWQVTPTDVRPPPLPSPSSTIPTLRHQHQQAALFKSTDISPTVEQALQGTPITRPTSKSDPSSRNGQNRRQTTLARLASGPTDQILIPSHRVQQPQQQQQQQQQQPLMSHRLPTQISVQKTDKDYAKLRGHAFGPNFEKRHQTPSNETSPVKQSPPPPSVSPVKQQSINANVINAAPKKWHRQAPNFSSERAPIGSERRLSGGSERSLGTASLSSRHEGHHRVSYTPPSHFLNGDRVLSRDVTPPTLSLGQLGTTPRLSSRGPASGISPVTPTDDQDLPEALRSRSGALYSYFSFLDPPTPPPTTAATTTAPTVGSQQYSHFTFSPRRYESNVTESKHSPQQQQHQQHQHHQPSQQAASSTIIGSQRPSGSSSTPTTSIVGPSVRDPRDKPVPTQKAVGPTRSPSRTRNQESNFSGFSQLFAPSPLFAGNALLKMPQQQQQQQAPTQQHRVIPQPIARPTRQQQQARSVHIVGSSPSAAVREFNQTSHPSTPGHGGVLSPSPHTQRQRQQQSSGSPTEQTNWLHQWDQW